MHSEELLPNIWKKRLSTNMTYPVEVLKVVHVCLKSGVPIVAAKQYIIATRLTEVQKKHKLAKFFALKAENALSMAFNLSCNAMNFYPKTFAATSYARLVA